MQRISIKAAASRMFHLIGIAVVMAIAVNCCQAITLKLSPANQTVAPGDFCDVSLEISGLGDGVGPSLSAYDLVLNYNPLVLGLDSVIVRELLAPTVGSDIGVFPGTGSLSFYNISFDSPDDLNDFQPSAFELATIRFTAVGAGISSLDLSWILLGDADGVELFPDEVVGASVTVQQVPSVPEGELPASGLLLLAFTIASSKWLRRQGA